ncbi:uncharacterized protein LOC134259741 [Saccostrea cucullata]|uniref:uncharacterized protein LOC134259741 n=1 Tax=Saccostrea cuccullata TaxID=36930 RepID=UPI002ED1C4F6
MSKSRHDARKENNMPTTNKKSLEYPCQNGAQSPVSQHSSESEKSSPDSSENQREKNNGPGIYRDGRINLVNGRSPNLNGPVNGYLHEDRENLRSSSTINSCPGGVSAQARPEVVVNCTHCSEFVKPPLVNGLQNRKNSPKANRPKSMSWSRVVKQRRDRREQEKKVGSNSKREKYIYPELGSSSDDSCDCFSSPEKLEFHRNEVGSSSESDGDDKEYSSRRRSFHSKPNVPCTTNEQVSFTNGHHEQVQNINLPPRFEDMPISAPLAVPEDSDGSSQNSGCDSNDRETETVSKENQATANESQNENKTSDDEQGIIGENMLEVEEQVEEVFTHLSSSESLEEIADEDNSSEIQENSGGVLVAEATAQSSSESLDEIGDYIETDFPSRASRHMFASSSEHSSTSSEEDEGYGVNEEKGSRDAEAGRTPSSPSHHNQENGVPQENDPHSPLSCQNLQEFNKQSVSAASPASVCDDLETPHLDSFADVTANLRYMENQSYSNAHVCRPKYIAKNNGDSMDKPGSDFSFMYSPETDFLDSVESDVPTSATSLQPVFRFGQDLDSPSILHQRNSERNSSEFCMYDPLDYASNDLRGAEGGVTNDLSMRRHSFEFDDVECNMESYDPHLCVDDNEHFNYLDTYKHEKVLQANFQNSESNRQEKVFFKALEKENRSTAHCDSSDEEENLSFRLRREHLGNAQLGHYPLENGHCMVLEDLENPTHAVRNAVIMPLPNKLDESSGESSEDPIYEDIDSLEASLSCLDNLHAVQEENSCDNNTKVMCKFDRRRRRGRRPVDVEKVMIWHEYEAYLLQVKQIGTSACGPTAVLTVLKAFDYQVDKEEVSKKIVTNTRMETAPISYYLFSRSVAGTTALQLIDGVQSLTRGTIQGRFFHFFPARKVELLKWLGGWIKKGAVPIATLNLQRGVKPGWTIPDAWHHQMIYGVSSKGVYLTNPLEIVSEETIMEQLTSDSILLIRRQDVVNRFRDWSPLNDLITKNDKRWNEMNVLGQVVNVLREACTAMYQQPTHYRAQLTSHIAIPAAYRAGITLFVRQNTEVAQELFSAPELEYKD